MKGTYLFTCFLSFVAATGFAQAPEPGSAVLARVSTPTANSCSLPEGEAVLEALQRIGQEKDTTCTVTCGTYPQVTCTVSGTCTGVERSCPGERGHITCNGVTTYCPACPICTEGSITWYEGFDTPCCGNSRKERRERVCVDGQWQWTGNSSCTGKPCMP